MGPFIYKKPMVLFDTQHWFDFIQASTGAQFLQPEYVIQRADKLAQSARQQWMDLENLPGDNHAKRVDTYLKIIGNAGNALASLTGEPISERRFFLSLPLRLHNLNQPELISNIVHLLSPETTQWSEKWPEWQAAWKKNFLAACAIPGAPSQLNSCRLAYYERAINAMWGENITAALWLLMSTWTPASCTLMSEPEDLAVWQSALKVLGLDEDNFSIRLHAMDHTLDRVEERIESWAQANGVSGMTDL
jgi:hypothetical protein